MKHRQLIVGLCLGFALGGLLGPVITRAWASLDWKLVSRRAAGQVTVPAKWLEDDVLGRAKSLRDSGRNEDLRLADYTIRIANCSDELLATTRKNYSQFGFIIELDGKDICLGALERIDQDQDILDRVRRIRDNGLDIRITLRPHEKVPGAGEVLQDGTVALYEDATTQQLRAFLNIRS